MMLVKQTLSWNREWFSASLGDMCRQEDTPAAPLSPVFPVRPAFLGGFRAVSLARKRHCVLSDTECR